MAEPEDFPAWVPCPYCDEFICTIHRLHAFECPCPPVEEWTVDPYLTGGKPLLRGRPRAWGCS